jgi:hypothetical protein
LTGLGNGVPYTFTVSASNSEGQSPTSDPSNSVTPAGLPGSPGEVFAYSRENSVLVLAGYIGYPGANGSPITRFTATASDGIHSCTSTDGTDQCTVYGLTLGVSYTFMATVTNDVGTSQPSSPSNEATPLAVPTAPTSVTAIAGDGQAVVSWTAANGNGDPVTSYAVRAPGFNYTYTWTSGPLSYTFTGLTNGTPYTFTVTASNDLGPGPASDPSNVVIPAGLPLRVTGVSAVASNASATITWSAANSNGSAITGYTVTASDGIHTCGWTAGSLTCTVLGLTDGQPYTFTVTGTNDVGIGPASDPSNSVTPLLCDTFHPVTPVRLLDTRYANGLTSKLTAGVPQSFQITGRGGPSNVPAGATAVTANVTIVKPSAASSVYLGPNPIANPTTATINFKKADITAFGSTISLGADGTMSATYMATSGTTDLLVDVTGYFTPDSSGDTYHPMTPSRLLDTRTGNGQTKKAKLKANVPITFPIRGRGGVPSNAVAVTGNVTAVNETGSWAIYIGPDPIAKPPASTMNFAKGQIRANSLTVALSSGGALSATFLSSGTATTDLVFDVTGYYTADLTGAKYVPITTPLAILDTRVGTGSVGRIAANTPRTFTVRGTNGIASNATAITGIVSVYNQTNSWAVFVGPDAIAKPTTSALNFLKGDNCSNGFTVALNRTSGSLSVTYMASAGNYTNVEIVVTGYFVP